MLLCWGLDLDKTKCDWEGWRSTLNIYSYVVRFFQDVLLSLHLAFLLLRPFHEFLLEPHLEVILGFLSNLESAIDFRDYV
jgi:hypothetical protein